MRDSNNVRQSIASVFAWLCWLMCSSPSTAEDFKYRQAESDKAMVATGHALATDTAVRVLEAGGNAVDAALSAVLTLGVVDGYNSGIGGGCFILIRTPSGEFHAIDGREMASRHATPKMYYQDGSVNTRLSKTGPLASGVPGAVSAYATAAQLCGQLPWNQLFQDAIRHAQEGFTIDEGYALKLQSKARQLKKYAGSRDVYFNADGKPWRSGDRLVQADLARTLAGIAKEGADFFYRGPTATAISAWMQANGGMLDREDFASYAARLRVPVLSRYRGYEIVGFPPPSSGGVHIAQILNTLEAFDLGSVYQQSSVDYVHLVTEALKLAFADRAYWLGDPEFAEVPPGLVDTSYGKKLAEQISIEKVSPVLSHGTPAVTSTDRFDRHTTHVAVADSEGYWVALTATINTWFGSKVVVPGTGVLLNNEMDDFSISPGVPNAFGLVGSKANQVEAKKRPLSSMSPTIVLQDGRPVFSLGAAGGPRIISSVLLAISRIIDLDMTPYDAIALPRFHHQWSPDFLYLEKSVPAVLRQGLEIKGHQIRELSSAGVAQMIFRDPLTGIFTGIYDPRINGKASGPVRSP